MSQPKPHERTCPLTYEQVIDRYFAEHRAKVLDVAAFLDRLDRSQDGPSTTEDFRHTALREAVAVLIDGEGERVRRILETLSDPTDEPIEHAPAKGADGAYDAPQSGAL